MKFAVSGGDEKFEVYKANRIRALVYPQGISVALEKRHPFRFRWNRIGILPGIGGNVSNLVSYIAAKNASKHPDTYWRRRYRRRLSRRKRRTTRPSRGACDNDGAWNPRLHIDGHIDERADVARNQLRPTLFISHSDLIYTIFAALIIGNIMTIIVEKLGLNIFAKLICIPRHLLLPSFR